MNSFTNVKESVHTSEGFRLCLIDSTSANFCIHSPKSHVNGGLRLEEDVYIHKRYLICILLHAGVFISHPHIHYWANGIAQLINTKDPKSAWSLAKESSDMTQYVNQAATHGSAAFIGNNSMVMANMLSHNMNQGLPIHHNPDKTDQGNKAGLCLHCKSLHLNYDCITARCWARLQLKTVTLYSLWITALNSKILCWNWITNELRILELEIPTEKSKSNYIQSRQSTIYT